MCKNLEDVFRYIDTKEGFQVAKVIGSGNIQAYNDEYYGYYEMYACQKIYILKFLSQKEVIEIILKSREESVIRFLMTCILNDSEKLLFVRHFIENPKILKYILYYQYNQKNAFEMTTGKIKQLIKNKWSKR